MNTRPPARELARHEAYHAAALCFLGRPPLSVTTDDLRPSFNGSCQPDWKTNDINDRRVVQDVLTALVMAPGVDGAAIESWPVTGNDWPEGSQHDEQLARTLIALHALDQVDWLRICCRADRIGRDPRFRRLVVAISAALERDETVLQPELEQLTKETRP